MIAGGSNFNGRGFFTGYWPIIGASTNFDAASALYGNRASLSNGIFVGGW